MNEEPHSHKKATVALVAVLLLAYVGSYWWMRQRSPGAIWMRLRVLQIPMKKELNLDPDFLDHFYWPLRKLDEKITGVEVRFDSPIANVFRLLSS